MDDLLLPGLCDRYPHLFSDSRLQEIACLPGWLPLIEALCQTLQTHLDCHRQVPQVTVRQVKEKYGSLKFIFDGGDDFCRGAVALVEQVSLVTCEQCGAPGELLGTRWFTVRCPVHAGS